MKEEKRRRFRRRKSLGQCFLEDRNILRLEARLADVQGKKVLEIGAGDGRLTEVLLEQKPEKIFAVERDPRYADILRQKFRDMPVEVMEEDFLNLELPEFGVVVGNIPYYISSDIIFSLTNYDFERAVLMVQKEFAEKMVAKPGDRGYGRLSVTSQFYYDVELERRVLRHLFRPIPKVDSAIVVLSPTGRRLSQFQENVIRYLFQHKNKTVRNALLASKVFVGEELEKLGDYAGQRPRKLSKEQVLEIVDILES
ncbi:ribosomal RNA small subunit methyltransferase A [Candidatus Micrarchaeota archaeon]|nr:ribosomal RNA small subunit methyltransferase A [Candidatus Micrarchaeota archaeon]